MISWIASRFEKVVLPDEEGPAMSTTRTRSRCAAMSAAMRAMRASCSASPTSDTSGSMLADDGVVEAADAADAEAVEPGAVLLEHREQLRIGRDRVELVRAVAGAGTAA